MATRNDTNKDYLTPNEVAELLMVSPITVRTWARKGLLIAKVTPGGHRRFLKKDVERFARESGATQVNEAPSAARVLIVDDEPVMTTYIHYILEDSGMSFATEVAQSGFEAGTKIHTFLPDIVLLDLMLPDIDGFRVCALIKDNPATRHIRVIAITGDASAENITRILEAGAEACLAKPINPDNLLKTLGLTEDIKQSLPDSQFEMPSTAEQPANELDNSDTLLFSLVRMAEVKNGYIGRRDAARLTKMIDVFGRSLGYLGSKDLLALGNACKLHDVGNLGIPDSILLKPAPLSEDEWKVMRSHTLMGAQLCSELKGMELTVPIIRSHHERWDGSGYPDGLKADAIPYLARVFQVVDIFDALTSSRPYKPALSLEDAKKIIRQNIANGWLDPNLGAAFLEFLNKNPQDFMTRNNDAPSPRVDPNNAVALKNINA